MKINSYTYKKCEFTCDKCKWQGLGSETEIGELFDAVFEIDCPICHEPVDSISHPNIYEILEYDAYNRIPTEKKDIIILEKSEHWPMRTEPEKCSSAIISFIEKLKY